LPRGARDGAFCNPIFREYFAGTPIAMDLQQSSVIGVPWQWHRISTMGVRRMAAENILAVNVPNTVSIVVMASVGGAVLALLHKLARGTGASAAARE